MNPRAARQASGMTRNEWARAMGVSVLTTKRWEAPGSRYARSPTQHRVERMERGFLRWADGAYSIRGRA